MNMPAAQVSLAPRAPASSLPSKSRPRAKSSLGWVLLVLVLAGAAGVYGYLTFFKTIRETYSGPIWTVAQEILQVNIVERGTLESAENSEIYCRVKVGGKTQITIKWIIDDGSHVERGQKLVELDDSALQDSLKAQLIIVNKTKSEWIQAEENYRIVLIQNTSDIETAKVNIRLTELDLQKYLEGDYVQNRKDIEGRIQIARSDREQWVDRAAWSQRMVRKGYLSRSQAESDQARLESSEISLNKVSEEMTLLEKYSKLRTTIDLESKLEEAKRALQRVNTQAQAKLSQAEIERETKKSVHSQEDNKRLEIEEEIHKCTVYSPQEGLVVYYVPEQSRSFSGSAQSIIAQGEPVREGQKMMRIPNLNRMQVNTRVHEAMVSKLRGELTKQTGFSDSIRSALVNTQDPFSTAVTQVAFGDLDDFYKDQDLEILYPGQKTFIRLDAFPTKGYSGTVKTVANVASQADFLSSDVKVYQTIVSMEGRVEKLKPGMSAEVTIQTDQTPEPVMTVPIEAVVGTISMGTKRKCFVLDEQKRPQERDIVLGLSNNKVVEVREGLQVGDKVVQNPAPLLKGERSHYRITVPGGRRGVEFEESGKKSGKKGGNPDAKKNGPGGPPPGAFPGGPGAIPGPTTLPGKRPEGL